MINIHTCMVLCLCLIVSSCVASLQLGLEVNNRIKSIISGLGGQKCLGKVHKVMFHVTRPSCLIISILRGRLEKERYLLKLSCDG